MKIPTPVPGTAAWYSFMREEQRKPKKPKKKKKPNE